MTLPLVLLHYKTLMPGSRLVDGLEGLGFRVEVVSEPNQLADLVRTQSPMALICDLDPEPRPALEAIRAIKEDLQTQHLPILAFADLSKPSVEDSARMVGATLIADRSGILSQLGHLMDHVLEVH